MKLIYKSFYFNHFIVIVIILVRRGGRVIISHNHVMLPNPPKDPQLTKLIRAGILRAERSKKSKISEEVEQNNLFPELFSPRRGLVLLSIMILVTLFEVSDPKKIYLF